MRILYFGSREWLDVPKGMTAEQVRAHARHWRLVLGPRREDIEKALRDDVRTFGEVTVIEGEADGADITARVLARRMGLRVEPYPVSGAEWRRLGKRAGPLRNERMLREGKPDMARGFIVGCLGEPMSNGSAGMLKQLLAAGVRTIVQRDDSVREYRARRAA